MVRNVTRRAALADAAVEVLAGEGARGLTFRAVDGKAGVPPGTASNYFANRDDLLHQACLRVFERLGPDPADVAGTLRGGRSRRQVVRFMHELVERVTGDRAGYLALLELRLEATRRPGLRDMLTETIRANFQESIDFHLDARLPGDRETVVTLYFAMLGLIVEHLTLPGVLDGFRLDELITAMVERIVPA